MLRPLDRLLQRLKPRADQAEVEVVQYTEEQRSEFIRAFKRRQRRQLVMILLLMVIFAAIGDASFSGFANLFRWPITPRHAIALIVLVGFVLFSFQNWRCPACNGSLSEGLVYKSCPKCGVGLR